MPVEPTAANLLIVVSYGIGGRIQQFIEVHKVVDELHGPRSLDRATLGAFDPRCKTCRTTSGKPCPWPCATWLQFAEILDLDLGPATIALYQAIGREKNGALISNAMELVAAMVAEEAAAAGDRPAIEAAP